MQKSARIFAQKIHQCLDELGLPTPPRERAIVFSKMLNIPKQQAWTLLEGHMFPDSDLLDKIADELEVEQAWLLDDEIP